MDEMESEETTEFYRVPDMPGYYISSNAPRSGEFVPVAMHDKLKRQRDMLLEALKEITHWVERNHKLSGKPLVDVSNRAIAAVEEEK